MSMLKTDVMPQVATVAPGGERFGFQQDLAITHTAAPTMGYLQSTRVELPPWLPSGADPSPLDSYAGFRQGPKPGAQREKI